ncbi:hypothetical protein HC928_05000 [bacterium]|nr:hypothetical protein [bacterium]
MTVNTQEITWHNIGYGRNRNDGDRGRCILYEDFENVDVHNMEEDGWRFHFNEEFLTWSAAHPDWVCRYKENGGTWGYYYAAPRHLVRELEDAQWT